MQNRIFGQIFGIIVSGLPSDTCVDRRTAIAFPLEAISHEGENPSSIIQCNVNKCALNANYK